jgi:hypothetical protein
MPTIHGVDFTSAPRPHKPITVATGGLVDGPTLRLTAIDALADFTAFELWLRRAGPWLAGFDFPFGLPREAVHDLGWPRSWAGLVRHCAQLERASFRALLDRYRASRPLGRKYPFRRGDAPAGAHSPIKLVNPPVALMFLEGAPRLLAAGVMIPSLCAGDAQRIALETYPGYAVRRLFAAKQRLSYKNDARSKQTAAQRELRRLIVRRITESTSVLGVRLELSRSLRASLIEDGSGDRLDAVLCALQAAAASLSADGRFGLARGVDPLEGWIATVPEAGLEANR